MVRENLNVVRENIKNAAIKSGRDSEVTLIAVSKTKPCSMLMEAYDEGVRDFGENYIQELIDKIEEMPKDIRWHMIGHLQTNKVKYIIGKVYLIHSVDSVKLAMAISKESIKKNVTTDILVEINVAGEESKFGSDDMKANLQMIKEISELPNVNIKGVMTIAPYCDNPESNREYFSKLYDFAHNEAAGYIEGRPLVSMGMTGDYEVAISEGADYVRVGTGIFGEREYSNKK